MAAEIKFCGLTRAEDADVAASLGAAYVGVIFADSPRRVGVAAATDIFAPARGRARTVGVFGPTDPGTVASVARDAALDVVQLHGDPTPEFLADVRRSFGGELWAVVRVSGAHLPDQTPALLRAADAVVLDTKVAGTLGGSGVSFDWAAVARALAAYRAGARIVLAGGLNDGNVAQAARVIAPDVVDVSSGVERAPGIKDHVRMRAFSAAVRGGGGGDAGE